MKTVPGDNTTKGLKIRDHSFYVVRKRKCPRTFTLSQAQLKYLDDQDAKDLGRLLPHDSVKNVIDQINSSAFNKRKIANLTTDQSVHENFFIWWIFR